MINRYRVPSIEYPDRWNNNCDTHTYIYTGKNRETVRFLTLPLWGSRIRKRALIVISNFVEKAVALFSSLALPFLANAEPLRCGATRCKKYKCADFQDFTRGLTKASYFDAGWLFSFSTRVSSAIYFSTSHTRKYRPMRHHCVIIIRNYLDNFFPRTRAINFYACRLITILVFDYIIMDISGYSTIMNVLFGNVINIFTISVDQISNINSENEISIIWDYYNIIKISVHFYKWQINFFFVYLTEKQKNILRGNTRSPY